MTRLMATVVLALALLTTPDSSVGTPKLPVGRFSFGTGCSDTVSAWSVKRYVRSASWQAETITMSVLPGRRYLLEALRTTTPVTVDTVSIYYDGVEYFSTKDLPIKNVMVSRIIAAKSSATLQLKINGSIDDSVFVRITQVAEPQYTVYGPQPFTRGSGVPVWQAKNFDYPNGTPPGPHQMILVNGATNGTNRTKNTEVELNGSPVLMPGEVDSANAIVTRDVNLDQSNTVRVKITSAQGTKVSVRFVATDASGPTLAVSTPVESLVTTGSKVYTSGTATDAETGVGLTLNGANEPLIAGAFSDSMSLPADGVYTYTYAATNGACMTASTVRTIYRDTAPPTLTLISPAQDQTVSTATIPVTVHWQDLTKCAVTIDGDTVAIADSGTVTKQQAVPLDLGQNGILVRAVDRAGHVTQFKRYVYRQLSETTPIALHVDSLATGEVASFRNSVGFLWRGAGAVQTSVDTTKIVLGREAVVRGIVTARDYGPIPNVLVKVLNHDEFGSTKTRSDGTFDMAVSGGSALTLRFVKSGFLESQRSLDVPIQDIAVLDTVAMVGNSTRTTAVDASTAKVIVGRFESDANGDRRLAMMFAPATQCSVTVGSTTNVFTQFHVRMKEYTVGGGGQVAMPSTLPPSSAYTYCIDYGLTEADAMETLGGPHADIRFNKPVVTYTKEFLGIPVGRIMPSGRYDPNLGVWKASEDGRVVRFLNAAGGYANLDIDGDGQAESLAQYAAYGVDSTERAELTQVFAPGDSLWRVRLSHFCGVDFNLNEVELNKLKARKKNFWGWWRSVINKTSHTCGCDIEDENRVLGEQIPIVGTPYFLDYRSDRQPGDLAMRTVTIPLTDEHPDSTLRKIHVIVDIAGQRFKHDEKVNPNQYFAPNKTWEFNLWNGRDTYGRLVQGSATATIQVGYEFQEKYYAATNSDGNSYGSGNSGTGGGASPTNGDRDRGRIQWETQKVALGAPSMASAGLSGWTISPHHFYDPNGLGALYKGDGDVQIGERAQATVHIFAGNGAPPGTPGTPYLSEGDNALGGAVDPEYMAAGPDGSVYYTDLTSHTVCKIAANGTYHRIAGINGGGTGDYSGDGTNAAASPLYAPSGIALGPDGTVYFTDKTALRVFKVTPDGKIYSIAGTGHTGTFVSGIPATQEPLGEPRSLALGPDGSLYVGDNYRVIRVGTDGIAHRFAGNGTSDDTQKDLVGRADSLSLTGWDGLACDRSGNVFIAAWKNARIYMISPDGTRTVHMALNSADPAKPSRLAIGPDGSLYYGLDKLLPATNGANGVYVVNPDSTASCVAGGLFSVIDFNGQAGQLARGTTLGSVRALAVGPDGAIFIGQVIGAPNGDGIYRVANDVITPTAGVYSYPSEDGREIYVFGANGQHQRTIDAVTGVVTSQFGYSSGALSTITDRNGLVTHINRGGSTTTIVGPFGQTTTLTANGSGYLSAVANPINETYTLGYQSGGLLTSVKTPALTGVQQYTYTYGSDGRLRSDGGQAEQDPAGGSQSLSYSDQGSTRVIARTTAEGRTTTYTVSQFLDGLRRRLVRRPQGMTDSLITRFSTQAPYGQIDTEYRAEGDSTMIRPTRDHKLGWLAPVDSVEVTQLPTSHRLQTVVRSRDWAGSVFYDSAYVNGNGFAARYDTVSRQLTIGTPLGRTTTVALDARGRATQVTSGILTPVSLAYDANGNLIHWSQGARAWRYSYDTRGRLQSVTDTLSHTTSYQYDGADRETTVTLPDGRKVRYRYDANGNLLGLTPPGGSQHDFTYTPVDLNSVYSPPAVPGVSSPATTYSYNRDGQLTLVTRPDGQLVHPVYNATTGVLDSVSIARGRLALGYSGATGQLTSATSPDGVTVSYGYDGSLKTSETWSGPVTGGVTTVPNINYADSTETVTGATGSPSVAVFRYDRDGLVDSIAVNGATELIKRRASDGLDSLTTVGSATTTYAYNAFGELSTLSYTWPGGSFSQAIDRDELGRVVRIIESGDTSFTSRTYDYHYNSERGWLDSVAVGGSFWAGYTYDANGNRVIRRAATSADTATAWYDAQDRLQRYGNAVYSWTANGELTKRSGGAGGTQWTTYDALGNLTGASAGGDTLSYLVDGANRRVRRQVNGHLTQAWLYRNELNVVAEEDSTGALRNRYVYGTQSHVPDLLVQGGLTYRLVTDFLGSVRAVVNVNTGTVAQRIDYDVWGVRTKDTAPEYQALGYAGGLTDRLTGFVRCGARDYEPRVGRWTSRDPVGLRAGPNVFSYVTNSPATLIDPGGTETSGPYRDGFNLPPGQTPWWPFVDPRPDAHRDAQAEPLGPSYHNAWEHALGGEYARRRFGVAIAECLNEGKEFYWDRYVVGQATLETQRDWWNSEQGISGRHRTTLGVPDSSHLIPDPPKPYPPRY